MKIYMELPRVQKSEQAGILVDGKDALQKHLLQLKEEAETKLGLCRLAVYLNFARYLILPPATYRSGDPDFWAGRILGGDVQRKHVTKGVLGPQNRRYQRPLRSGYRCRRGLINIYSKKFDTLVPIAITKGYHVSQYQEPWIQIVKHARNKI